MAAPYTKPHLSLAQQLQLLVFRGMDVGDRARAERYLGQLGYYRLSGYWYPARQTSVGADAAGDPSQSSATNFVPARLSSAR